MANIIFRGSKTEQMLINAFAGESQARNRYTYYAKIAKKEGFEQIGAIFLETAENELEHAKLFYKHLENLASGQVNAFYPFTIGTTKENLFNAIKGEEEEYQILYLKGEKVALDEGFDSIASTFKNVQNAEKHHAQRFQVLLDNIIKGTVFEKSEDVNWVCRKCGYTCKSKSAPEYCPNCYHKRAYFQILCDNY